MAEDRYYDQSESGAKVSETRPATRSISETQSGPRSFSGSEARGGPRSNVTAAAEASGDAPGAMQGKKGSMNKEGLHSGAAGASNQVGKGSSASGHVACER
eukprot:1965323-Rhodomonas_salina.2